MRTHSIRHPLTVALCSAALLLAPVAFAAPAAKTEAAQVSSKLRDDSKGPKGEKGKKQAAKKRTEKGKPYAPPAKPAAVPELDGGQWASAAALLGGAFLLIASRRRARAA